MQALSTSRTSLVQTRVAAASTRTAGIRAVATVRCEASKAAPQLSRRAMAAAVALAVPAAWISPAGALIDYDEDDELLAKVRADRKAKVQSELLLERNLVTDEGFKDKKFGAQTAVVQKTVYRLSKAGSLLAAKDTAALGDVLGGDWPAQLKVATATLSLTPTAKTAADTVAVSAATLQKAVGGKKEGEIKSSYLAAVTAIEAWCAESGLDSSIKGL